MSSLLDSLKVAGTEVFLDGVGSFANMTLGDFAKKLPGYGFSDDSLKTMRLDIGPDGRVAGFTLSEDYESNTKLSFSFEHLSLGVSLSSKTSVNDWTVIPKPTVNSLMKHAADYSLAGNPEGYANFLTHNQKGVVRLIEAGKTGAPDRPDDMYWKKDVDSMNSTFTKCSALLTELAAGNDRIAEQAKSLQPKFAALVDEVKNQGNLSTDAKINLAKRFFTVAAQIYTLKAMKG